MYFFERVHPRLSSTLDALRWISAALVVISHVRSMLFVDWAAVAPSERNPLLAVFYLVTSFGHQAVVVFFVISGFLVGGSVVNDIRRGRFAFASYLVNRVSRLYIVLLPALLLGAVCDLIGSTWFNGHGLYVQQWPMPLWSLQFHVVDALSPGIAVANVFNLQTIAAPPLGSNGPLWSLANEFWYYLLFPLAVAPFMRWRPWGDRLLLVLVAGVIAVLVYPHILLYAAIWLVGVAARCVPKALIPWPWLSTLVLLITVVVAGRLPHWYEGAQFLGDGLLAVAVGNLLLTVMHHGKPDAVLWGGSLHPRMADFSYSLYLLHFPMLVLACAVGQSLYGFGLSMAPNGWLPFLGMGGVTLLVYVYAWGASLLTERHTAPVRAFLSKIVGLQAPTAHAKPAGTPTA